MAISTTHQDWPEGSDMVRKVRAVAPDLPERRTTCLTYKDACTDTTIFVVRWQSNDGEVHEHKLGHIPHWIHPSVARIDEDSLQVLRVRAKMTSCL